MSWFEERAEALEEEARRLEIAAQSLRGQAKRIREAGVVAFDAARAAVTEALGGERR